MKYLHLVALVALAACQPKGEVTRPIHKDLQELVFATGTLEPEGLYALNAQTDGYISQLLAAENDTLSAGAVLAVIEDNQSRVNKSRTEALYQIAEENTRSTAPRLAQARAAVESARLQTIQDSIQARRYAALAGSGAVATADVDQARQRWQTTRLNWLSAREALAIQEQQAYQDLIVSKANRAANRESEGYTRLQVPKEGRIYGLQKQVGDYVRRGEVIAYIGATQKSHARVTIDENNIAKIKPGQHAWVRLNTQYQKLYEARVRRLLPTFDLQSQSFICELEWITAPQWQMRNTQLEANIETGIIKNALVIPRQYLSTRGEILVHNTGEHKKPATGVVSNQWVQILSGLDESVEIEIDVRAQ